MMKKVLCLVMVVFLMLACASCGKSEAFKTAEEAVKAIGEVTLDSGDAIQQAEKAVEGLTAEEKESFKMQETLDAKKAEYSALQSQKRVDDVIAEINAIGEVNMDAGDKVKAAKKQYDALTSDEKQKVTNAETLLAAEKAVKELKAEVAENLLANMKLEEDRVRGLKFYYPNGWRFYSNGSWAADISCFMRPYIGRDSDSAWLRLVYNYTGDDWVFFKSLLFAVDGKNYSKTFKYFDIVHDNGGGDVWEYIDVEVEDSDLEMLWAIANSNETIIRFQGDDYSHDYTVSKTDKQALKDALTVYEALN